MNFWQSISKIKNYIAAQRLINRFTLCIYEWRYFMKKIIKILIYQV